MTDAPGIGDPLPWLVQSCAPDGAPFALEAVGGRFALFCLPGDAEAGDAGAIAGQLAALSPLIDAVNRVLFVVVPLTDAQPYRQLCQSNRGIRVLLDADGSVRRALHPGPGSETRWLVSNPRLQVVFCRNFASLAASRATIADMVRYLPSIAAFDPHGAAPVLSVSAVVEKTLCAALIDAFEAGARLASPVMVEHGGAAAYVADPVRKVRTDSDVPPPLLREIGARLSRRLAPEIDKAFQCADWQIDRAVLSCYGSEPRGHFAAHRDNTLPQTRHRRFACSINLNDDYEGGFIAFPEFGARAFRPAAGAALVFSCSLMHLVTPVTKGRRYALLLFLR